MCNGLKNVVTLSIYNVLKTVTRELEMTILFIGVGRFVWTQEGDVYVTPEELTEQSGGGGER